MNQTIISLALLVAAGFRDGAAIFVPSYARSEFGGFYHHSGCKPSSYKPGKTRRAKAGRTSQAKIRKNRRRAHAAGAKDAFAR